MFEIKILGGQIMMNYLGNVKKEMKLCYLIRIIHKKKKSDKL